MKTKKIKTLYLYEKKLNLKIVKRVELTKLLNKQLFIFFKKKRRKKNHIMIVIFCFLIKKKKKKSKELYIERKS